MKQVRKTITPGDGDARHGTPNGYSNLSCRCTACRGAWADHYDEYRKKPRGIAADDPRHGTENAYRYWHCKCRDCLDAHTAYRRSRTTTNG